VCGDELARVDLEHVVGSERDDRVGAVAVSEMPAADGGAQRARGAAGRPARGAARQDREQPLHAREHPRGAGEVGAQERTRR
jgi:hypothetical protein